MITTSIQSVGETNHMGNAKDDILREAIALAQRINHRLAERADPVAKAPALVDVVPVPPVIGALPA